MIERFWVRRCRGCDETLPHTHHLTRFGRWYLARYGRKHIVVSHTHFPPSR